MKKLLRRTILKGMAAAPFILTSRMQLERRCSDDAL